jgi:hypothetical protein
MILIAACAHIYWSGGLFFSKKCAEALKMTAGAGENGLKPTKQRY